VPAIEVDADIVRCMVRLG